MSLLAHLVSEWRPRDAATTALAYILDPHASPGMAEVFVNLLGRTGVPAFPHGRVKPDTAQEDGSRPDVTINDVDGKPRVLVEATFWEGVEDAQPVGYLAQLPRDVPSALVFIAPRDRIPGLWTELKARCNDGPGIDLEEESSWDGEATWARTDRRVLVVASWTYVFDTLRREAGDPEVQQDILQLQGLAERMEDEAFLPIDRSEVTDVGLARRMMGYCGLVNKITDRLVADGVAHLKKVNWSEGSYQKGRMVNRSMQVHGKFDLRFGVELAAWRDSGLTPLWWVLTSSATYKTAGDWQRIKNCLDGVRSYDDSLYIPIRLTTGADETRVIDDAVGQMSRVPLRGEEPSDLRVARRMLNYAGLIDSITDSLVTDGVADTKGLRPSGWGRYLRMHARFGLWLHVDLVLWYRSGITPVWTKHNTNSSFSGIEGKLSQAEKMFTDAQETDDGVLCVPIRLKTGVERGPVIDDAVKQMRSVADGLLEVE